MEIVLIFLIYIAGSFIQGITGFGFGLFVMSFMPLFVPFPEVILVVLLINVVMTAQMTYRLRSHVNVKFILVPLVAALAGRTIGIFILMNTDGAILQRVLGVVLILFSVYFAFFVGNVKLKPSWKSGTVSGLSSGVLGGMLNTGGPPLVAYYFWALPDKMAYNASLQLTFCITSFYSIVLHIIYGNMSLEVMKLSVVGIAAIFIGSSIGIWMFRKIKKEVLSKLVYILMAVMGIVLLLR